MRPCYYIFIFISFIYLTLAATANHQRATLNEKTACLIVHNNVRAAVGLQPLMWSKKLTKYARSYAEKRRADCQLKHSGSIRYGENIFWGSGKSWSMTQAAWDWASENKSYHYSSNSCDSGEMCGHYTQIVWRNTTKVGVGAIWGVGLVRGVVVATSEVGVKDKTSVSCGQDTLKEGEKGSNYLEDPLAVVVAEQNKDGSAKLILIEDTLTKKPPLSIETPIDSNLVEVTIQPSPVIGKVAQKKKASFTRKPRHTKAESLENMQVDRAGSSGVKIGEKSSLKRSAEMCAEGNEQM
ncbi:pathogenesis-related protein 1 [Striga asiatica]|uniref:Pathogenesis-related protein 1 n=1 Tax=Striga asiatica TaxID=4170 RepID=A0A5A7PDP2_STRAF|nr:pathogenesis-related protein 1 [Striga asiatica]